jgi:catalase
VSIKSETSSRSRAKASPNVKIDSAIGNAQELHQRTDDVERSLRNNQGVPLSDNQNSLRATPRGPTLLEDFILREKITHFDHERIPERIVHARGSAAHGHFELKNSLAKHTRARVLTQVGERIPVFCRFSTVVGGAGSIDTPRDVRGFAVKFYTPEGNWDLVGNNIPVFFIQDAIKFPDLIHAVKMEPDRAYPQAASAHDTFWDFISLMPESMHMVMWAMSDRTLPRSLRMMEGFGVHSFRLVNQKGASTFVKFHWRPKLGLQSTLWDEAVKIAGADPDFHRRDLYESIAAGHFPQWDLGVQLFTQEQADRFPFDHLDATKLIPEELVPVQIIGTMVLDRNPDNFFAETEQVAFCPSHVVPGIDFSNDPLLQGRLHSYLDTQLSRLGGPNFHQIPINRPKCPFANFQRDGVAQMNVPRGRVAYEPNTLSPDGPRETLGGFSSYQAVADDGVKGRIRAESFSDHYSQARLFYTSQSEIEQAHLASALVFELSKVETVAIRARMVANLRVIDDALAARVADGLGLSALPAPVKPAPRLNAYDPSPALRLIDKYPPSLQGRCVGILLDEGSDAARYRAVRTAVDKAGARVKIVAPKVGGVILSSGDHLPADGQLSGTPSILFDAIAVLLTEAAAVKLAHENAALEFAENAFIHLKAIGFDEGAQVLLQATRIKPDMFVVPLNDVVEEFVICAGTRLWTREPFVRRLD